MHMGHDTRRLGGIGYSRQLGKGFDTMTGRVIMAINLAFRAPFLICFVS